MGVMPVRELVHIVTFKTDKASVASVEATIHKLGMAMSAAFTLPIMALGKHIIDVGKQFDDMRISINNFAGDAKEAQDALDGIVKVASSFPTVQMTDIAEPITQLIARGVKVKDLVSTFKDFETVIGAVGGSFSRFANAYAETVGFGKLRQKEFNQYVMGGKVPIREILATYLNVGEDKIQAMVHAGKISADVVRNAFALAAKEGSKYYNMMIDKAGTLWGAWKILADKIDVWLSYGNKSIYSKLQVPLKWLMKTVGGILDMLQAKSGNFNRWLTIFMSIVAIVGPIAAIWKYLVMLAGPISVILSVAYALSKVIDDIYVWIEGGDSIMGLLFGDIGQYTKSITWLLDTVNKLKTDVVAAFDAMRKAIDQALDPDSIDERSTALRGLFWVLRQGIRVLDGFFLSWERISLAMQTPRNKEEMEALQKAKARNDKEREAMPLIGSWVKFSNEADSSATEEGLKFTRAKFAHQAGTFTDQEKNATNEALKKWSDKYDKENPYHKDFQADMYTDPGTGQTHIFKLDFSGVPADIHKELGPRLVKAVSDTLAGKIKDEFRVGLKGRTK